MALPAHINDREQDKFEEVAGQTTVRTKVVAGTLNYAPSGLRTAGRHTFVTVSRTSWVALPSTALTDRNGISIQNESGIDIKIRYVNTDTLWRGTRIAGNGSERFYDIKETIILYAMADPAAASDPEVIVEELS